ncbi:hypothetical protein [Agrobacterium sp.]|uniref:hypothetical protein n=1 Tax=Agrobacterium sp. TaxID=361 RepID=UPI0028AC360D|nr:hypothetical protein [Agrobacterium sp.]
MDYVAVVLTALAVIIVLIVAAIVALFLGLRRLWRNTKPDQTVARGLIVALGVGIIASCYVGLKIHERNFVLARVPAPLDVAEIEYRQEELWGVGFMPGDNETGLVVYRLTDESAEWARSKGNQLPQSLLGEQQAWAQTPVADKDDEWGFDETYDPATGRTRDRYPPDISGFLGKYGFDIVIEDALQSEVNKVIQSPGSFYSYGSGGSVTIVDPANGKVYFAYAG